MKRNYKPSHLFTFLRFGIFVLFAAFLGNRINPAAVMPSLFTPIVAEASDTASCTIENSLFIGDSRTVGLMEYGQINGADFFCSIGMNVFDAQETTISVPDIGKVTLSELLNHKQYDKIYLMLGINELGYPFEDIIAKYEELIECIKTAEPNASIIIQANLHVTASRSDSDGIYNNSNINDLNSSLSEFADNQTVFYLNVNPLFDDAGGALSSDKSSDNTHPYGKYYVEWAKWIAEQTNILLKEE